MNISLFEDIRKEFSVDASGITYVSKKGLGRLSGVDTKRWFRKDSIYLFNKKLDEYIVTKLKIEGGETKEKLLESLISKGLIEGGEIKPYKIMDLLADIVIKFYAYKAGSDCTPQAELVQDVMSAIGFRSAIQEALGWQKTRSYEAHILAEPRQWTKVFEDDYYDQLARLSGLKWDKKTHRKPLLFAQLTKELVYGYLPKHIYDLIKKTQKLHGGEINKMHQFLDAYSLTLLRDHLQRVIYILSGETSLERAKQLIHQAVTKEYQHRLFG